jgi:hypothetical protein
MAATARAVDLTNVKEGGNFRPKRKPEGDYKAKIVKADDHQPNDKSKPLGWVLTIQVEGDARATYPVYLSPEPKQAWKIRQVCVAAGLKPPAGRIRFDPNKLVNKAIGVALADDEYEGRVKSSIDEMFPVSEVGANADEDVPDVDLDEEEVDEDEEVEEEPEPAPKPRRRAAKPAPEPEPEEDEEYEDEEEEPSPPPKRRRTTVPPTKKVAAARRKAAPVVDEEDEDLDLDELDD